MADNMVMKDTSGWWSKLNSYQRFVFIVATAAWLFDCLDQQLFNLARMPALTALMKGQDMAAIKKMAGIMTSIFVLGWATGGMIFGSLGDRYGRAKMLGVTVLLYSISTGLSALSTGVTDFAIYRFLTGLGVGGVFGLAVALVSDTLPNDCRPKALGVLQSFSAVGNVMAGLIGIGLAMTTIEDTWKYFFWIGALPAMLTASIQFKLKEPDAWVVARDKAVAQGRKTGSYKELFRHPTWRKHALLGMILSCAGVIGLWGIGVFSTDMVGDVIENSLKKNGASAEEVKSGRTLWMSINLLCFNVGAFAGMLVFTRVAVTAGRKKAFAFFFVGAAIVTVFVFQNLQSTTDVLWMAPIMGFFQLSVFAGFSIYLAELFPTSLRSTGVSFCYNVGRYLAAAGPITLGYLASEMAKNAKSVEEKIDAFRDAASWMCLIFLIGVLVLPFLPETKDQPLPQD
jgi:MFS family permease